MDGIEEVCVACDSEEAAKHSESASMVILPIVAALVLVVVVALTIAVNMDGWVRDWWIQKEQRIMVRRLGLG